MYLIVVLHALIGAVKESILTCGEVVIHGPQLPYPATPILSVATHNLK